MSSCPSTAQSPVLAQGRGLATEERLPQLSGVTYTLLSRSHVLSWPRPEPRVPFPSLHLDPSPSWLPQGSWSLSFQHPVPELLGDWESFGPGVKINFMEFPIAPQPTDCISHSGKSVFNIPCLLPSSVYSPMPSCPFDQASERVAQGSGPTEQQGTPQRRQGPPAPFYLGSCSAGFRALRTSVCGHLHPSPLPDFTIHLASALTPQSAVLSYGFK